MASGYHRYSLLLAALVLFPLAASSQAGTIRIEAESYYDSLNVGGNRIESVGGVLYGVDYPGDLTRYNLATTALGLYSVSMRVWGELDVSYKVLLVVEEPGQDERALEFQFVGKGACGH